MNISSVKLGPFSTDRMERIKLTDNVHLDGAERRLERRGIDRDFALVTS